ncbi:PPC domain-containing protein [Telmatocola sphagniphila]|uniref:PPC domain-containing protein n=1 Tax=Telmatocola sphagniphila TaxID=1123043 RepID=A0A8E6B9B7_9BACT|nr:PPC domain-containing protein [Telmatocola sphagniphila]QVL33531.1 PPC domain-containing protein [Telmatocola sphagniphila]
MSQVLCNNPNVEVKILGGVKKIANQPGGDTEIQVELNFKQKIAEKNLELRLVSKESTSEPLILIIDLPGQITREMEPNDGFSTAQKIQAPTVIEGTIGKPQDVDVYCLELKQGDNLELSVWASRLKTITDPILSLYDSEKNLLKLVDDMSGSRDPELKYVIAKDGKYYFSITEANDQGGPVFSYRVDVKVQPAAKK